MRVLLRQVPFMATPDIAHKSKIPVSTGMTAGQYWHCTQKKQSQRFIPIPVSPSRFFASFAVKESYREGREEARRKRDMGRIGPVRPVALGDIGDVRTFSQSNTLPGATSPTKRDGRRCGTQSPTGQQSRASTTTERTFTCPPIRGFQHHTQATQPAHEVHPA